MSLKTLFPIPGRGVARGMAVTAKNWIGSYFDPDRLVTVQYPEERAPLPENSRSFPFLIHDGDDPDAGLRCLACHTCEKECPVQAITVVGAKDENGKPAKHPDTFEIDISVCIGCQICAEVCPFGAIAMDNAYDYAGFERFEALILNRDKLAKPNAYYHTIKPHEAAEVDSRLRAERERKEQARQKKQTTNSPT